METTLKRQERPRMLVDAYIAVRVLKEELRRISGVPTGTSVLTTMFGIGVLATVMLRIAAPTLRRIDAPERTARAALRRRYRR
jgi:hypothetical protein